MAPEKEVVTIIDWEVVNLRHEDDELMLSLNGKAFKCGPYMAESIGDQLRAGVKRAKRGCGARVGSGLHAKALTKGVEQQLLLDLEEKSDAEKEAEEDEDGTGFGPKMDKAVKKLKKLGAQAAVAN